MYAYRIMYDERILFGDKNYAKLGSEIKFIREKKKTFYETLTFQ